MSTFINATCDHWLQWHGVTDTAWLTEWVSVINTLNVIIERRVTVSEWVSEWVSVINTLNVIIERQVTVTVFLQQTKRIVIGKVFKLYQRTLTISKYHTHTHTIVCGKVIFAIFKATAWNYDKKFHKFIICSYVHKTVMQHLIVLNYCQVMTFSVTTRWYLHSQKSLYCKISRHSWTSLKKVCPGDCENIQRYTLSPFLLSVIVIITCWHFLHLVIVVNPSFALQFQRCLSQVHRCKYFRFL